MPGGAKWIAIMLFIVGSLFGILYNFPFSEEAQAELISSWSRELVLYLDQHDFSSLVGARVLGAPDNTSDIYVYSSSAALARAATRTIRELDRPGWTVTQLEHLDTDRLRRELPGRTGLGVFEIQPGTFGPSESFDYMASRYPKRRFGLYFTVWNHTLVVLRFALVCGVAVLLFRIYIFRFRSREQREFALYEEQRSARLVEARHLLEEARALQTQGLRLKAVLTAKRAVDRFPNLQDARALHAHLLRDLEQDRKKPTPLPPSPVANNTCNIFLRIGGTPYAYRGSTTTGQIRAGRRRVDPVSGEPANDFVIRVPSDHARSLRVSRQHFVLERVGNEYFITDNSSGGTRLRGDRLESGRPRPIRSGDRITLSDALVIEFITQPVVFAAAKTAVQALHVPGVGALEVEATVGELTTIGGNIT